MNTLKKRMPGFLLHPIAILIVGLILCTLALGYYFFAQQNLNQLEAKALYLKHKQHCMLQRKDKEQQLLTQMRLADRDYIEKEIQSLEFLKPEIQKLRSLGTENPLYAKRLHALTSSDNRLSFKEQNFQNLDQFREVELIQKYPVEMNQDDLKLLLSRIENVQTSPSHPPSLLIKKCELQKKQAPTNEETFVVQLEILKREIVHE